MSDHAKSTGGSTQAPERDAARAGLAVVTDETWQDLVEHANDIVYTHDLDGRFTSVNHAAERVLGYPRDEILAMTVADVLAPESLALARLMMRRHLEGMDAAVYDVDVIARDGQRLTLEVSTRLRLAGAAPTGIQGIARDVTDRNRADEALRRSEQRFRVLVEHSADGLLLLSADGHVTFASRPVTRWLGYAPEEVVGRNLLQFIHAADHDRVLASLAEVTHAPSSPLHAEYRCQHRDGGWRLHEAVLISHLEELGVNAIVLNFRDVTERRAAETALLDSEERFRTVFESALIGIARVSLDGRLIDVNRALLEMGRFTMAEVCGRSMTAFLHPDDLEASAADFSVLTSGRRNSYRAERRYIAKDGTVFWANVTSALVRDASGTPQFVLAMLENITERKQTEAELRHANEELSAKVRELEERTREIGLLSDMGDLLRACRSPEEACSVVVPLAAELFPRSAGVVSLVAEGSAGVIDAVAHWGTTEPLHPFTFGECWALRRGRLHVVQRRGEGPGCQHLDPLAGDASICVPMMAHGETLGVLSLTVPDPSLLTEPRQRLVMTVAEHVSLALANLRLQDTLRAQSIRDPLTGLFNRRYMEESVERELRRAVRNRTPVGIIMLDLDHFKAFNDVHGHDAGDALLCAVGTLLQRAIRAEDIACRYGGEEFTLILPEASLHEAAQRAEHIRQAVAALRVLHRRQTLPAVTVSAGVAVYPEHGPTADVVLRAADVALYQAKALGRDRVVLNQSGGLFPQGIVEYSRRG